MNSLGTLSANVTNDEGETSDPVEVSIASAVPTISNFQVTQGLGSTFTISGQVADESPNNLAVSFGGLDSLQGLSATTASDGTFSLTVNIPAGESGLVSAQVTDCWGLTSDLAQVELDNPLPPNQTPTLTFTVTNLYQNWIEIAGQVTDENPGDLYVYFTGIYDGYAVTNSDGSFSITVVAGSLGSITGTVTDSAGQSSDSVVVGFTTDKPAISNFQGVRDNDNTWTFSGHVEDECPLGLEVYFGGLDSLNERSATVDANGDFSLTWTLAEGETGSVWAQVTDWWSVLSDQATWLL
jgi:hypothetical protein